MNSQPFCIPVDTLQQFVTGVFVAAGMVPEDAAISAEVLVRSDRRGIESHGVSRLRTYYEGLKAGHHNAVSQFEIVTEGPATAVVDGHNSMGHVTGVRSMQLAIDKARQSGVGVVAVRNSSHFGIAGYYALMAVRAGMIGMAFTNAHPSVAPTFAVQPMLGTNPIAFGAPSDEDCPFLFDAATSIAQRGKIEVCEREGKPVPEGWVIDHLGRFPSDPGQVNAGFADGLSALLPLGGAGELLGGYKGYGLSVMVEILCSALQQNLYMHHLPGGRFLPAQVGHFFAAIDIDHFVPLASFQGTVGGILRELRAAERVPGQPRIYTAGEKEFEREQESLVRGVPVSASLLKELKSLQSELGLFQYRISEE